MSNDVVESTVSIADDGMVSVITR